MTGLATTAAGRRRLVLILLLALVAAVTGWRALDLARHGWQPSAAGEQRWMGWGHGNGWERALLAALPEVPPGSAGERLVLRVETPERVRPNWLRGQVQYLWPDRHVAAVEVAEPGAAWGPPTAPGRVVMLRVVEPLPAGPATAGALVPARPARDLGGLAVTLVTAFLLGSLLLPGRSRLPAPEGPVVAAALGLALLTPTILLAATVLPRLRPAAVLPGIAAATMALLAMRWWRHGAAPSQRPAGRSGDRLATAAGVLLLAVLALFVVKIAAAPLWSWDHYSIWGVKARVLGAVGPQPELLESTALERSSTHYPMGLPALIWTAAFGGAPTVVLFKAIHLLVGVGVVLLVRGVIQRAGGGTLAATTLAALVAASPLLWDTELLGLADLPLVLWALAGLVVLVTPVAEEPGRGRLLAAGTLFAFLPWLKSEGLTLAAFLLAGGLVLVGGRSRRLVTAGWLAAPAAVLGVLLAATQHLLGAHGNGFLAGAVGARLAARLGDLGAILGRMGRELLAPHWLGAWIVFALAVVLLLAGGRRAVTGGRQRIGLVVAAVVAAQLGVYGFVYLATYLEPMAHLESSFRRIAAALWPLAAAVVGLTVGAGAGERVGGGPRPS